MPILNAKSAGDNYYPQYNVSKPEPVGAIAIVKGRLYTKNAGNLALVTATGFIRGIYQATRSIITAGTAGGNTVDCFGPRTRVGLTAKTANLQAGDLLKYDIVNHNVELWTGTTGGITPNELNSIIGRVYKIYSRSTATEAKTLTAVGDTVIVDLGVGI